MNKNYLFVVIFLLFLVGAGAYFIFRIPSSPSPASSVNIDSGTTNSPTNTNMNDQLQIQDEVVGTGAEAIAGKKVTVNYTGTLTDGTVFDSSVDPKFNHVEPFAFNLGAGQVIAGWDQGFTGMKVGGKRKLTIPPSLGYGSQAVGNIPANSTLIFEVELLKVE